MNLSYKVLIDLTKPLRTNTVVIKQNNTRSIDLDVFIQSGGQVFDMTDVMAVSVRAVNENQNIIYDDATIVQDENGNNTNEVVYSLPDAILKSTGRTTMEFEVISNLAETIASFDIYVEIQSILFNEDDLLTADEITGFRIYMARALAAMNKSEAISNAFNILYGSTEEVLDKLAEEYDFYLEYIQNLQDRVDRGEFTGARGPQGENGADAVVTDSGFVYGMQIVNGELVLYYDGEAPGYSIDDDGNLVIDIEEAD